MLNVAALKRVDQSGLDAREFLARYVLTIACLSQQPPESMMKFFPVQLTLSAALVMSSAAYAQTPAPAAEPAASPLTFNISLASNYKFRGQDQDRARPAR